MTLYWRYITERHGAAGARPPELARDLYAKQDDLSPYKGQRAFEKVGRAIEAGYRVTASDCPPMRAMAQTGFVVRAGAQVTITGRAYSSERWFGEQSSAGGAIQVAGDAWPDSDSGYLASWISGSNYLKLQTGLMIVCPRGWAILQGPVPNSDLTPEAVQMYGFTAIERFTRDRHVAIDGEDYFAVELNFIYRAPAPGDTIRVVSGQLVGWFLPLALPKTELKFLSL